MIWIIDFKHCKKWTSVNLNLIVIKLWRKSCRNIFLEKGVVFSPEKIAEYMYKTFLKTAHKVKYICNQILG